MPTHRPVQTSPARTDSQQSDPSTRGDVLRDVKVVDMVVERAPIRLQIVKAALQDTCSAGLNMPLNTPTIRGVQPTPSSSMALEIQPVNISSNHDTTPLHDNRPFNPWEHSSATPTTPQSQTLYTKDADLQPIPQSETKEAAPSPTASDTTLTSDNEHTLAEASPKTTTQTSNESVEPTLDQGEMPAHQSLIVDGGALQDAMNPSAQNNHITSEQPIRMDVTETITSRSILTSEPRTAQSIEDATSIVHETQSTDIHRSSQATKTHDTLDQSSSLDELNNQQKQEYNTQRSEHVRLLQQIDASLTGEQTPHSYTYPTQDSSTYDPIVSPQHETLHHQAQEFATTRASIFHALSTLENQLLNTSPVASPTASEQRSSIPHNIQGRQNVSTSNPTLQKEYDAVHVQRSDRSTPHRSDSTDKPFMQNSTLDSSRTASLAKTLSTPIPTAPHEISSILSIGIPSLLVSLRRFTESTKNLSLLQSFDSPLENACLTIATGIAVGLVGPALAIRTTYRLAHQLRTALTGEDFAEYASEELRDTSEIEQEKKRVSKLDAALQGFSALQSAQDISNAGLVADVAGIVFYADSRSPTQHAKITSTELGTCITTAEGLFLFSNIPLGTSYTLSIQDPRNNNHVHTVEGSCSEITYLRIGLT